MIEKVKSDEIALKPNRLILAGQQMLPYQQKVFLAALSALEFTIVNDAHYGKLNDIMNNAIERFWLSRTTFKFPIDKIFENYEGLKLTDNADFKKEIEKKTGDIVRQVLFVKDEKTFKAINIIDYAEYKYEEKTIHIQFSKAILPILFEMFKEGYTKIHLISFMRLRSSYSMRLYEILMYAKGLYMYKNGYTLSIKDLYFFFGIDRDKEYKEYKHFKSMILLRCRKEIEEKTGLSFDFEEIKKGAKVDAIKFKNILEDPEFDKMIRQISLFENNGISEKEAILSSDPSGTFLLDVLKNPQSYIVSESIEKTGADMTAAQFAQLSLPISEAEIVSDTKQKFSEAQNEKLDKYLEGIFSADEIKLKYEFDYIEFYYNKAKEKDDKELLKNFPGFLYKSLIGDKYKYYELKEKEKQKKEAEENQRNVREEAKKKAEQEAKRKAREEKEKYNRLEEVFDSIPDDVREKLLNELYKKNPLYKSDNAEVRKIIKWVIAETYEKKQ